MGGDCLIMIHVDDLLLVGNRKVVMEELVSTLQSKYTISVEMCHNLVMMWPSLKRTHHLMDDGRMVIRIHIKHLDQL